MYENRNGKQIEVRILKDLETIENIQGNVYQERAHEKRKAQAQIKEMEDWIAKARKK